MDWGNTIAFKVVLETALKMKSLIILMVVAVASARHAKTQTDSPPHCTHLTKSTDFESHYKFDYPIGYINPGVQTASQALHCILPQAVNKEETVVCDWAAPPQVEFNMGDEFVNIKRQDPSGLFSGKATIKTYQLCNHNIPGHLTNGTKPIVSKLH